MTTIPAKVTPQLLQAEWAPFAGGELEGRRPKALCPDCRERLSQGPLHRRASGPLCFACYRLELQRERAFKAAAECDTASEARFQSILPLPPVNRARLARLKVARRDARRTQAVASPYVDRRRQAQINARHALSRLAEGIRAHRQAAEQRQGRLNARAAQVTLPDAWLPFVSAR